MLGIAGHLLAVPNPAAAAGASSSASGHGGRDEPGRYGSPKSSSIEKRPWDTPEEEARWQSYCEEGRARALSLGNRGPVRFDAKGVLAPDIVEAFKEHGFYVFEGVMKPEEVADFHEEFQNLLDHAPAFKGSPLDKQGRPAQFAESLNFTRPLEDRWVPAWNQGAEQETNQSVVAMIFHPLHVLDAALRLSAHPLLLRAVEGFHGPDFTPFTETLYHKPAGEGSATYWHQDGRIHWDADGWPKAPLCHGFNVHGALSRCTPENGLWILPGSQRRRYKVPSLEDAGGHAGWIDRLEGAVPMIMEPGDVGLQDRSVLHGAFPNRSPEPRVTLQFGFHARRFVLGTTHTIHHASKRFETPVTNTYDEQYIHERSRMIQIGIDARRRKYPDEVQYVYQPLVGEEDQNRFDEKGRKEVIQEYWRHNIAL